MGIREQHPRARKFFKNGPAEPPKIANSLPLNALLNALSNANEVALAEGVGKIAGSDGVTRRPKTPTPAAKDFFLKTDHQNGKCLVMIERNGRHRNRRGGTPRLGGH